MPRGRKKKELPEIPQKLEGNLQETHIVQKSRPLFSLWKSDLTLGEFKILDTYLSRINSHNADSRDVGFTKSELEQLLGVTKINQKELDNRLKHLMGYVIRLENPDNLDNPTGGKNDYLLITLFERAACKRDEYGQWHIDLRCTASAMKYFFDIEKIGYLRYKIRNISHITSLYSYIMFTYLEFNRFRKSWSVPLAELKQILNCTGESYKEFKIFNDRILKRCYEELHEKTELRYTYEPIKTGRRVSHIQFTLETITDLIEPPSTDQQLPLFYETEQEERNSRLDFLMSACDDEFTPEQIHELLLIMNSMYIPPHPDGEVFAKYRYLAEKYAILQHEAKKKKIPYRFKYLRSIIRNEREEQNG